MKFLDIILALIFVATHTLYASSQESKFAPFKISDTSKTHEHISSPIFNIPDSLRATSHDFSNKLAPQLFAPHSTFLLNPYLSNFNTDGMILFWTDGYMHGADCFTSMPALGNIQTASVSFTQQIDRFNFSASLHGTKYHLDRSVYNDFGIAGRISYLINSHLSLNVFGNYSHNNIYHSMASLPYTGHSSYGSSVTYAPSDRFNVEIGVQRYYDTYSGRWVIAPIVAPKVNISGIKLGADIGGLIYQIIQSAVSSSSNEYRSNPTIAPPKVHSIIR